MPVISFKKKLKGYDVSIAFNTCYNNECKLKIKNTDVYFTEEENQINEVIKNFDEKTYQEYLDKYNIVFVALAKYFIDKIPNIFSIKFEDKNQKFILYADEIENFN
ncbi:MAG: hypothetical protein PUD07_03400 [bacterium]|nr:hypothetical protein [bacterium]